MNLNVCIVGAGISGLSCAQKLSEQGRLPVVFEQSKQNGGLIKCSLEQGNLFHRVGGHVFNSKNPDVQRWFWKHFDKDREFLQATRRAAVLLEDKLVDYPIEDHLYQLSERVSKSAISEIVAIIARDECGTLTSRPDNFKDFLLSSFGKTLYDLYFEPYNSKIWKTDLASISLEWLDGKLPMPNPVEILMNNILRKPESEMVHAKFYYPKEGGSQLIADRLSTGLTVISRKIDEITINPLTGNPCIDGVDYSAVVYTGDIRQLRINHASLTSALDCADLTKRLRSNSTTTLLCECDKNPYSWVYLPESKYSCHRIIMTGNFSPANNSRHLDKGRITCTVEFSGINSEANILECVRDLPFRLRPIAMNYEKASYVIQDSSTRKTIAKIKSTLAEYNIYLCGRLAEWEYYNMDKAIESADRVIQAINGCQSEYFDPFL